MHEGHKRVGEGREVRWLIVKCCIVSLVTACQQVYSSSRVMLSNPVTWPRYAATPSLRLPLTHTFAGFTSSSSFSTSMASSCLKRFSARVGVDGAKYRVTSSALFRSGLTSPSSSHASSSTGSRRARFRTGKSGEEEAIGVVGRAGDEPDARLVDDSGVDGRGAGRAARRRDTKMDARGRSFGGT